MLSWIDGQPARDLPLADRGWRYGDGLFETVRVEQARLLCWTYHQRRLRLGCARLGLPAPPAELADWIGRAIDRTGPGMLRLAMTAGESGAGYRRPRPATPHWILQWQPIPPRPAGGEGIVLYPFRTRLPRDPALAGLKHANRLPQVLARAEWQDQAEEGLMCDTDGFLAAGTASNLFWRRGSCLYTPPLAQCGVWGTRRQLLLDEVGALGLTVCQQRARPSALADAEEVFICNARIGIRPVRRLGHRRWPVGPQSRRLQAWLVEAEQRTAWAA